MENATILIPDISGYTDFISKTELDHSTHIITELLGVVLEANGDTFQLIEIEGDALLLYRGGDPLSKDELQEHCLTIFKAFHSYLKVIERDRLCDCGACMGATGLNLKFVAHFGQVNTLKVGHLTKPVGLELVVAHRLLKNSINRDAYLLFSDKLLEVAGPPQTGDWIPLSDEYPAIGKIDYCYRLLDGETSDIPDPPPLDGPDVTPVEPLEEITIDCSLHDVYEYLLKQENKWDFVPGIIELTSEDAIQRVGSKHVCLLEGMSVDFEMVGRNIDEGKTVLVDRGIVREMGMEFLNYWEFQPLDEGTVKIRSGVCTNADMSYPQEFLDMFMPGRRDNLDKIKEILEQ